MQKIILAITCCLLFQLQLNAQFRKVLHQTFEFKGIEQIVINITGDTSEIEVKTWSGNLIMTETAIQVFDASSSVIDYFLKEGRYDILANQTDSTSNILTLSSKDSERRALQVRRKVDDELIERDIFEIVKVRIFIPEEFIPLNEEESLWEIQPDLLDKVPSIRATGIPDSLNSKGIEKEDDEG